MFAILINNEGTKTLKLLNNDNGKLEIIDEKKFDSSDANLHFMTISEDNIFYNRFSHGKNEKNKNHYKCDNNKLVKYDFDNYAVYEHEEYNAPEVIGECSILSVVVYMIIQ